MNGLSIGDIDIGIDVNGVENYLRELNIDAIGSAITALRDTNAVKNALQAGWQGQAEINFEKNLDRAVESVVSTLEELKQGLEGLFSELVESYAEQDNLMVAEEDILKFN